MFEAIYPFILVKCLVIITGYFYPNQRQVQIGPTDVTFKLFQRSSLLLRFNFFGFVDTVVLEEVRKAYVENLILLFSMSQVADLYSLALLFLLFIDIIYHWHY